MNKNLFVIGFMLFAMFFGAGNLIFPPKLGLESGGEFWLSMAGLVITGVGLPLLGIVVSGYYEGGYQAALKRIHPWFSVAFLMAIYLAIGPFFAGPRTGATAYEMAIVPFLSAPDSVSLLLFSALYFSLTLWLSLNPSKMVERIGAWLTPVLLCAILALVIGALFHLSGNTPLPLAAEQHYFVKGILEGYLTMDALASVAFSVIVLNAIKAKVSDKATIAKQTVIAGVIAAVALGFIYIALGWLGNHSAVDSDTLAALTAKKQDVGTYILNHVTAQIFGDLGRLVLGVIVSLACLTTAVGLMVSVSEYFYSIFPKISYKAYVVIFVLISFVLANQGLKAVISTSLPVLLVLYPIAMTVILLLLLNLWIPLPLLAQRLALIFVVFIAISAVLGLSFVEHLPLNAYSMAWLPFAIGGIVVGYVIDKSRKTQSD